MNSASDGYESTKFLTPISINHLSDEILCDILQYFQNNEQSYFVKLVCKKWRFIVVEKKKKFTCSDVANHFAREGNLGALQWFKKHNYPVNKNSKICAFAAEGGCVDVLNWLKENGCTWDKLTYNWAAYEGKLESIKWLKVNGCPWDSHTCDWAAKGGRLEVLKWLRANGCPWTQRVIVNALNSRHFEVVDWARENGCPYSTLLDGMIREEEHLKYYLRPDAFCNESDEEESESDE